MEVVLGYSVHINVAGITLCIIRNSTHFYATYSLLNRQLSILSSKSLLLPSGIFPPDIIGIYTHKGYLHAGTCYKHSTGNVIRTDTWMATVSLY